MSFSSSELERWARQLALPEWSGAAQERLRASTIALLGAGGIGVPASLYLAGAGVGRLIVIDDDRIERSNLHRQPLYADAEIGALKASIAAAKLRALSPPSDVVERAERLGPANAAQLIEGADLVLDGADNFAARDAAHAAALGARIPYLWASAQGLDGQLALFRGHAGPPEPCLRCAFADDPPADALPSCASGGVLGPLVGAIGSMAAMVALRLLGGFEAASGELLAIDGRDWSTRRFRVPRSARCPLCSSAENLSNA